MEDVSIFFEDLVNIKQTLKACLTYYQAVDIQKAQMAFSAERPSPLTVEVEQVLLRCNGYIGDYLQARHEAELEEDVEDVEEDSEVSQKSDEQGSEEFSEDEEEELSATPLSGFERPIRKGRRLSPEEILPEPEPEPEPEAEVEE